MIAHGATGCSMHQRAQPHKRRASACWPAAANTRAAPASSSPERRTTRSSRTRPAHQQQQWHTGETQECDQHKAILIGCDGGLLFEMALHQQLYLLFP